MAPPLSAKLHAFLPLASDLLIHDKRDLFPVIADTVSRQSTPTESVGFFMALTRRLMGKTRTETLFQVATHAALSASVFLSADYETMRATADTWRVIGALTNWSRPGLVTRAIEAIRREMPMHCYLRQTAEELDQRRGVSTRLVPKSRTLRLIPKKRPQAREGQQGAGVHKVAALS